MYQKSDVNLANDARLNTSQRGQMRKNYSLKTTFLKELH